MFLFIDIVLFIIALGLAVPIAVLFIECCAALLPARGEAEETGELQPRVAILVPAHNEAVGIGATLETLLPQLTDRDRIVIVADNCTDETAAIARRYCDRFSVASAEELAEASVTVQTERKFGATVLERTDAELRGKGYALDYGLQFIATDPPDALVMVDADSIVHEGAIARIARDAVALARPVQSLYLMELPANPGPKDSVSALAFLVKNLVRPKGLMRLGLPGLLTGTGMAFPWSAIQKTSLASGNIVEDMQLSLDLAIAGYPTRFCQEARVTGRLPQQGTAAKSQRTRWEHGHLQTLLTQVPRMFNASIRQRRWDLFALALDMCVPPISVLVMLWVALAGGALVAGAWGASWIPAILLAVEGLLILIAIVGAWAKFGRDDLPALTLLAVPFYLLWKIPLYLAFIVRPQTKWVRTERDTVDAPES